MGVPAYEAGHHVLAGKIDDLSSVTSQFSPLFGDQTLFNSQVGLLNARRVESQECGSFEKIGHSHSFSLRSSAPTSGGMRIGSAAPRRAESMSLRPLPVINRTTVSFLPIRSAARSLTSPANDAAAPGSAKTPVALASRPIALRISSSLTVMPPP